MEPLHVRFIIEILGKPAAHVSSTMHMLLDRLAQEKGVSVTGRIVHEPKAVPENKGLFTTFAEVEARFESINVFFGIIFAYMPSNIEVISPGSLKFTNEEVTTLGNTLVSRLHLYESVTKKLVSDRDVLMNKLKSMGVTFPQQVPPAPATEKEKKTPSKKKKASKKR